MRENTADQRELRVQIARLRRRLDRDVDRSIESALAAGGLQHCFERHPARSLAAAVGIGAALGGLAPDREEMTAAGRRLASAASGASWPQIWRALLDLATGLSAGQTPETRQDEAEQNA